MPRWIAGLLLIPLLEAAPYSGAAACAECHGAIARSQAKSHHTKALRPIRSAPLGTLLAGRILRERGGFTLEYRPAGEAMDLVVSRGDDRAEAILEWAERTDSHLSADMAECTSNIAFHGMHSQAAMA